MIFVTGASGLVGSHLIQSLIAKNKAVTALYRKEIPAFEGAEKVKWVQGDLLDIVSLAEAMQGVHQVYHCAAIVSFVPSQAARMIKANQEGTANVVNLCIEKKIDKLVFVSSVAALGRIINLHGCSTIIFALHILPLIRISGVKYNCSII